jgi:protein phosphatase
MVFQVMQYNISFEGLSNKGLVRQNNEDYWAYDLENNLFVLADGMGGHRAGEIASREAVEGICSFFKNKISESDQSLLGMMDFLFEAICEVNFTIYRMSRQYAELRGMGTTLCCVKFHTDGLVFGHVGDSRIYRLRNKQLERLTKDHSLLRELIDLGQLSEQQADDFLYKNILTKAIGTESSIEPSVLTDSIEVGDTILMCSDGLTDMLTDEEIQSTLIEFPDNQVAQKLIDRAIGKGGHDNVTVVLIFVQGKHDQPDLS